MITPVEPRQPKRRSYRALGVWAACLLVALGAIAYGWRLFQPVSAHGSEVRYVRVASGQSADEVALTLQRAGIIESALAFKLLSRWDGLSEHLTAGVYRLSPTMTLGTILGKMRDGDVVVTRVAIPEGWTVQQVVDRLVARHIGTLVQYRRLEQSPLPGMPRAGSRVRDPLEGYLLPATYSFPYGTTARQALETMWKTFQIRVTPIYNASHSSLTLQQWVTLASIVQAEDKRANQASTVAGVFVNRLRIGMPLQSDATVRYAIGHPVAGGLSLENLQYASPYNTYLHTGLPPGPIDNPGIAMLTDASRPAQVPYLYFLALRNGDILFATTYQQHLANIQYADSHSQS